MSFVDFTLVVCFITFLFCLIIVNVELLSWQKNTIVMLNMEQNFRKQNVYKDTLALCRFDRYIIFGCFRILAQLRGLITIHFQHSIVLKIKHKDVVACKHLSRI